MDRRRRSTSNRSRRSETADETLDRRIREVQRERDEGAERAAPSVRSLRTEVASGKWRWKWKLTAGRLVARAAAVASARSSGDEE